ncbi:hypothetical protein [Microbulbifer sp. ANSA005]|uniref:hypothetical protein n=1 Tax=Microbulbifer sp. ANSA005 TaxID=3243362 RepID=UPI004042ECCF
MRLLQMLPAFFSILSLSAVSFNSSAQIDFESIPNSSPVEGMAIGNQFEEQYGVRFSMSDGTLPVLSEVGAPLTAFVGPNSADDTPAENQSVGQFFLTDDNYLGLNADLIIDYTYAVSAASGALLDIDGEEEWTITAYNIQGDLIGTIIINNKVVNTGDGLATAWSFEHDEADIKQLRFSGTKPNQHYFGLAFDNFSPSSPSSCEPSLD